jgi:type I restriction enzyme M protein
VRFKLLFVKYVSNKNAGDPNALIDVPAGGGFADMVAAQGSKEIGDRINKIIGKLADANDSLKGAINVDDFNDEEKLGKADAMVQRLTKLVAIFAHPEFTAFNQTVTMLFAGWTSAKPCCCAGIVSNSRG